MQRMRYFGTDGIRDDAVALLNKNIPFRLGRALSQTGGKVIVARDVRVSSRAIENQLVAGLLEGPAQIWLAGVLPTPALAYVADAERADFAVMITASHNPPRYNGLKVFGKRGRKLSREQEIALDRSIDVDNAPINDRVSHAFGGDISHVFDAGQTIGAQAKGFAADGAAESASYNAAADGCAADALTEDELKSGLYLRVCMQNHRVRIAEGAEKMYKEHVLGLFKPFSGAKVRIDAAHGCFARLAGDIFAELGIDAEVENNTRDGELVNVGCGSAHMQNFLGKVGPDEIGFAFDGDGDRVLAVVDGRPYDGDAILLALATMYKVQGKLKKKLVVGTKLTNTRLQKELARQNIALLRTDVGDKYVLDALNENGSPLGGEKSGHIIMTDKAMTGDGILTALSLLEAARVLGGLPKYVPYPMLELNIPADDPKRTANSPSFLSLVERAQSQCRGRLIVRPSGTEPYIRVAFECFDGDSERNFDKIRRIFAADIKN